jgi:diaminopimelate decarboxylase
MEVIGATDSGDNRTWDITGYTCMEDDVLYRKYAGPLKVGDYIVFSNVGAYSIVLRPPFIRLARPILMVEEDGMTVRQLRSAETDEDLWRRFAMGG